MAVFSEIKIDANTIYRPNEFRPEKEYIYAGEYTTCRGALRADIIGWKYADMTLQWGALPDSQLQDLLDLDGTAVTMSWTGQDGTTASETVIPTVNGSTATRFIHDGESVWSDVQLEIRFIDAHN